MGHRQNDHAVRAGQDRKPLVALAGGLREPHIEGHQFRSEVDPCVDQPLNERDVQHMALVRIAAEIEDIPGMGDIPDADVIA